MTKLQLSAERLIDAPAEIVYTCIADYQRHHRPGGFLPPAFHDLQITRGGLGAGTAISFKLTVGGRTRTVTQEVTEPEPGRVLMEFNDLDRTIFTVEPAGNQCRVRIDTLLEASGLEGILTRLFAPRLLQPLYADELERLERYARDRPTAVAPAGSRAPDEEGPAAPSANVDDGGLDQPSDR